jgi:hypothetical protein
MSDSYDDYESKMQLAEHVWEKRVDKMVKTEHNKQIDIAQAYERGWNAALAQLEWVGLTEEEVSYFEYQATFCDKLDTELMAELIEQALKKKNNGRYRNRATTEITKLKEKNQ